MKAGTGPSTWRSAALVLAVVGAVLVAGWVASWVDDSDDPETAAQEAVDGLVVDVRYEVTGTADGVDLTMTDGDGSMSQATNRDVPLTVDGRPGIRFQATRGSFLQLSAQNTGDSGDITCRIVVDGRVVDEATSVGGYVIASCSATT